MKIIKLIVLTAILAVFITTGIYGNEQQEYTFHSPAFKINAAKKGFTRIDLDGFQSYDVGGYPNLPSRIARIVVPPTINPKTLEVEYTIKKISDLGECNIEAIPPMAAWTKNGWVYEDIADIYSKNDFFPRQVVEFTGFSQMRKWQVVNVKYTPFQYNPVTRQLRYVSEVDIRIRYKEQSNSSESLNMRLKDTVMDHRAEQLFMNYQEAIRWYEAEKSDGKNDAPSVVYDYVIITTNAIESASTKLANFTSYLSTKGFNVLVITEDEFGGLTGQAPNGTAEKIRKWLQNNYLTYSIQYVLLVGNPHPSTGDIPMKMCWPRYSSSSYRESPTDYYYADLTGNWDKDGDGNYGEYEDYTATGGVDLANEVVVGRIPVYSGVTDLDAILTKIISYGNSADTAWRKNALLPMSFSSSTYDGAPLAEQMKDDYLTASGYSYWTLYQQGSGACGLDSTYASDEELRGGTVVRDRWAAGDYGLVLWWGHGSQTSASVGCDGCWDGTLFSSSYAAYLDNGHPSFVYLNSCNNGYPENSNNLQYALLKNGGIGTVGASRVSWYNSSVDYGEFDGSTTNGGIGFEYAERLVQNFTAGNALYDAKTSMTPYGDTRLMNYYDFNLYGDPSSQIGVSMETILNVTSPNGGEDFQMGSNQTISWSATPDITNVKIEYSTDNGNNWTEVTASTPSDGRYGWIVPDVASSQCLVRVGDTDGNPIDVSDSVFTISNPPSITLTSPNGGESWTVGTNQNITWTTEGSVSHVKLEYSTAGLEGTFISIVGATTNDGSYEWIVPEVASSQCLIRISELDGSPTDISDSVFQIIPVGSLTVTAPNGGETLVLGTSYQITWTSFNLSGMLSIQLLKGGSYYNELGTVPVSDGSFLWSIPEGITRGFDYRIRVIQNLVSDQSDSDFTLSENAPPPIHPDMNKDNQVDLLWRHCTNGQNGVWYMNGVTRTGQAFISTLSDCNWVLAGTGDFNNDGKSDLVWRHKTTGQNGVWFMNGASRTGITFLNTLADTNWELAAIDDFNGDGHPDLVWRHKTTGQNGVWFMNGTTRTGQAYMNTLANTNWHLAATADFNLDGKPDLVWRDTSTGQNGIWYMNGYTRSGQAFINTLSDTQWILEDAADFNGDGKPDILWRNKATGQNGVWYMNGTSRTEITFLNSCSIDWEIVN